MLPHLLLDIVILILIMVASTITPHIPIKIIITTLSETSIMPTLPLALKIILPSIVDPKADHRRLLAPTQPFTPIQATTSPTPMLCPALQRSTIL